MDERGGAGCQPPPVQEVRGLVVSPQGAAEGPRTDLPAVEKPTQAEIQERNGAVEALAADGSELRNNATGPGASLILSLLHFSYNQLYKENEYRSLPFLIKLAIGQIIDLFPGGKLRPDLMMVLLVLLTDQPTDFLHLLVVLPDACLIAVLDLDHSLGLLLLAAGVGLGGVVDGGLRLVLCLGVESGVCSDLTGVGKAVVAQSRLQHLPLLLFLQKLLPGLIAEGDQPMNPFGFCLLPIPLLLPPQQRLLELGVLIIIGVVELVHLVGGAMRVVPNETLGLVKLPVFEELAGLREGRMGQDSLEIVILNCGLAGVLHLSIKLSSANITNKRVR